MSRADLLRLSIRVVHPRPQAAQRYSTRLTALTLQKNLLDLKEERHPWVSYGRICVRKRLSVKNDPRPI